MFSKTVLVLASLAALSIAEFRDRTPTSLSALSVDEFRGNVLVARDPYRYCLPGYSLCPDITKCHKIGYFCCNNGYGSCPIGTDCVTFTWGGAGCCPKGGCKLKYTTTEVPSPTRSATRSTGVVTSSIPTTTKKPTPEEPEEPEEPEWPEEPEEPETTSSTTSTTRSTSVVPTRISTTSTFPTATNIPSTDGAVKGAAPAAAMGIFALAGFFGIF